MTKKIRKKFTREQKQWAVDEYVSERKSADQIAEELGAEVQYIYRWKTLAEEKLKGLRIEELVDDGNSLAQAKKILELEQEIEMYQKKVAELSVMNDLLKKLPGNENFQSESELTGLIRTTKSSDQKRKRVKR